MRLLKVKAEERKLAVYDLYGCEFCDWTELTPGRPSDHEKQTHPDQKPKNPPFDFGGHPTKPRRRSKFKKYA